MPRRRARDQDPDDDGSAGLNKIKVFLQNRLSPSDFRMLEQLLQQLNSGGEGEQDDQPPQPGGRQTDLLPGTQPNIPREDLREVRNNYAQDARGSDYFSQFPGNRDVQTWNYGG